METAAVREAYAPWMDAPNAFVAHRSGALLKRVEWWVLEAVQAGIGFEALGRESGLTLERLRLLHDSGFQKIAEAEAYWRAREGGA